MSHSDLEDANGSPVSPEELSDDLEMAVHGADEIFGIPSRTCARGRKD